MPNQSIISFTVRVKSLVKKKDLDFDDKEVAGDYEICLPTEASDWSEGQQATYVLDRFHETVAIAVLDDFDISVFSEQGVEVFEDDPEED